MALSGTAGIRAAQGHRNVGIGHASGHGTHLEARTRLHHHGRSGAGGRRGDGLSRCVVIDDQLARGSFPTQRTRVQRQAGLRLRPDDLQRGQLDVILERSVLDDLELHLFEKVGECEGGLPLGSRHGFGNTIIHLGPHDILPSGDRPFNLRRSRAATRRIGTAHGRISVEVNLVAVGRIILRGGEAQSTACAAVDGYVGDVG